LDVNINGRETYFEWLNAGLYTASTGRGTMSMAEAPRIERLYFGFDVERLLLRLDAHGGIRQHLEDVDTLRIVFSEPAGFEMLVIEPNTSRPIVQMYHNDVPVSAAGVEAATDVIFELAVGWRSLAATTDAKIHFHVELIRNEQVLERIPHEGTVETAVPSPDFELMMWQA
jgi:hypothetical protein